MVFSSLRVILLSLQEFQASRHSQRFYTMTLSQGFSYCLIYFPSRPPTHLFERSNSFLHSSHNWEICSESKRLSIKQFLTSIDRNLTFMNVYSHLLMISIVVGPHFHMISFKFINSVIMFLKFFSQIFNGISFEFLESYELFFEFIKFFMLLIVSILKVKE